MDRLLKIENFFQFVFVLFLYFYVFGFNWFYFVLFLFAPDLSMIGYFFGNKSGAFTYNLVHNLILPSLLLIIGILTKYQLLSMVSLIIFAHIFLDRLLGYGLKYVDGFKHTHLSKYQQ